MCVYETEIAELPRAVAAAGILGIGLRASKNLSHRGTNQVSLAQL